MNNKTPTKLEANEVLDDDLLEWLAESQQPVEVPPAVNTRMRHTILEQVAREAACQVPGFETIRAAGGEWLEPLPGARIKILHEDRESGAISYLARLEPGFEMPGHGHPIEEECMMLEGDLWMGDLRLEAGDYHFAAQGLQHGTLRSEKGALAYLKGALPI